MVFRHEAIRGDKCESKRFQLERGHAYYTQKGNKYRKALAGNGMVKQWFSEHDSFEMNKGGAPTMLKRLTAETGIQCNAHAFRRGFAMYQIRSIYQSGPYSQWLGANIHG